MVYNKETIEQNIHTKWAGKTVHFAKEIDSTNLWIKRLAKEGAPEGTLALAEYQSAGRGRLGRSWEVPEGTSVMMSILLRPDFQPQYAPMLTLVMGMAVAKAVKNLGFDVSIKWPNDVVVSRKKICGILIKNVFEGDYVKKSITGIGVNVNNEIPPELQPIAINLKSLIGKVDTDEFSKKLIENIRNNAVAIRRAYYRHFYSFCAHFVIHGGLQVYAVARVIVVVNHFERVENSVFKQKFEHGGLHIVFAVSVPIWVAQNAQSAEFAYFLRYP